MTDHIDKIMSELNSEITQLNNDLNIIEQKNQLLPLQIDNLAKMSQYNAQLQCLDIITESLDIIDRLKASKGSTISLFNDCLQLYMFIANDASCQLSSMMQVKIFNDLMESQKRQIEEALLVIKFPMFEGFLLRPIIDKMKKEHEEEFNILSKYLSIMNYLSCHNHKNELINDVISIVLTKKIFASILMPFISRTSSLLIGELIDAMKIYLLKSFYNLNELIILMTPSNTNPSILMACFINNTFHILNEILNKYPILKAQIENNLIDIIQRISSLNNDLFKTYAYDVFINESFNNFIRSISKNSIEDIITNQKKFCHHLITITLKEKLRTAIDSSQYNTEDIIDIIKLIFKDNMNMFIMFNEPRIIDDNILYSSQEIIAVFKGFFTDENRKYVTNTNYLFIFNLLFCYMEIFGHFRNTMKLNTLEDSLKDNADRQFIFHSKDLFTLIEWYNVAMKQSITFDNIVQLFSSEALSKLTKEKLENSFKEAESTLKKLYSSLDEVKAINKVEEFIISNLLREFAKNFINQLDASLKKGTKGKEIELLTIKMKKFTYSILNRHGLSNKTMEEFDQQITEINSFLSYLTMYKQ